MVRWQVAAVLGAAASVAITGAALLGSSQHIESDVVAKATAALTGEALSWARVTSDGRDVNLEGFAPSEELRQMAIDRLDRLFGVRVVDADSAGLLPEVAPYQVVLTRDENGLTISGSAPSLPDRTRLVEALTKVVPNIAYNDKMRLARGAPDKDFLPAVGKLLPLLGKLDQGTIDLTDHTIKISGVAASNAAHDFLVAGRFDLPEGYKLAATDIIRPVASPFLWSAESDGHKVMVSGYAPDRDSQLKLFGVLTAGAPHMRVIDTVDLASGEPGRFTETAAAAADYLDMLAFGRVDISDNIVSITGRAATPEAYRTLTSHLSAWRPEGFKMQASIELPVVAPYTLVASRKDKNMTVSGFAPSEELKAKIKGSADKLVGLNGAIVETTLAGGAPEGFENAAGFGFEVLGHLKLGSFVITDKTITISGAAEEGSDLVEIDALMASARPEGFKLDVNVTPPVVSPYLWTIEKTDKAIEITGNVPSESVRSAIRDLAEGISPDLGVADRTSLASGLPDHVNLKDIAGFAAEQLAKLTTGTVFLNDSQLSILGESSNAKDGMAVIAAMDGKLPRAVAKGLVQVDFPPAFQFHIERGLDAITIDGTVSGNEMTQAITEAAKRSYGDADVIANLQTADGMPDDAQKAALIAVKAASLLSTGTVAIDGTVMTVQGKTFSGMGAVRLPSELAGLMPKGFRLDTAVGVAKSEANLDTAGCETALVTLMGKNAIYFDSGSAGISGDSHGLLDRISGLIGRCSTSKISIEGHTDSDGDAAANQTLSEDRAKAVMAYLVELGIGADRLSASGFGATKPVADNATEEGKAKNRRIELHAVDGAP